MLIDVFLLLHFLHVLQLAGIARRSNHQPGVGEDCHSTVEDSFQFMAVPGASSQPLSYPLLRGPDDNTSVKANRSCLAVRLRGGLVFTGAYRAASFAKDQQLLFGRPVTGASFTSAPLGMAKIHQNKMHEKCEEVLLGIEPLLPIQQNADPNPQILIATCERRVVLPHSTRQTVNMRRARNGTQLKRQMTPSIAECRGI
ncbi:hypothetical protein FN846DRAFT_902258 [Sphaerosporella brunnea]|uniref:Secreted protein n=1 Tax=Sphaerosporella brunnea TaxID=1250544 RepID=A0A5J5FAI5_9PEZI|nr:hypothetical protein FN846DRAFT_902258 [Sphaerosporella brunnea]